MQKTKNKRAEELRESVTKEDFKKQKYEICNKRAMFKELV